jgi:hypothetical protein
MTNQSELAEPMTLKLRWITEKVGCKRGIEISISFPEKPLLIVLRLQAQTNKK